MKNIFLFSFLLIFYTSVFATEPADDKKATSVDYYSCDNIGKFAHHLFEQKDFIRAAWEYDRLRSLAINPTEIDSAAFWAGLSYMNGKDFERARQRFQLLIDGSSLSPLKMDSRYYFAKTIYFQGKFLEVSDFLQKQNYHKNRQLVLNGSLDLLTITYARMGLWKKGRDISCTELYKLPIKRKAVLCSLVVEGINLPHKSKLKAGLLSAVVPGLGKLYARRKMDALYAFFLVGTTAWQSYSGFDRNGKNSVQGWIYGILAGALYLGNIYGATVSVEIFNRNQRGKYFNDFEMAIGLKIP